MESNATIDPSAPPPLEGGDEISFEELSMLYMAHANLIFPEVEYPTASWKDRRRISRAVDRTEHMFGKCSK